MKRLIVLVVLLAAATACLGFYLGWFTFTSEMTSDGKQNLTVTVDKDKIHDDKEKAKDKVRDAEQKVKDKAADAAQKAR
jgi:hypothetical protein